MSSSKKFTCKRTLRQVFYLSEAPSPLMTPYSPSPLHTVCVFTVYCTYSHRGGGRGGGRWTRDKIRGAIVDKRGRKYQHDWLSRQSINSIKHQKRRHLEFGVFINIWSMALCQIFFFNKKRLNDSPILQVPVTSIACLIDWWIMENSLLLSS
jgi:hypothetical protein